MIRDMRHGEIKVRRDCDHRDDYDEYHGEEDVDGDYSDGDHHHHYNSANAGHDDEIDNWGCDCDDLIDNDIDDDDDDDADIYELRKMFAMMINKP